MHELVALAIASMHFWWAFRSACLRELALALLYCALALH